MKLCTIHLYVPSSSFHLDPVHISSSSKYSHDQSRQLNDHSYYSEDPGIPNLKIAMILFLEIDREKHSEF